MKKKWITGLLFVVLTILSQACVRKKTQSVDPEYTSTIRILSEYYYKAAEKGGEIKKTALILRKRTCYNEEGKILEEEVFEGEATSGAKTLYFYDEEGRKTKMMEKDSNGTLLREVTYQNDEKGYCTQEITYEPEKGQRRRQIYTYDERGNCIEKEWRNPDGEFAYKIVNYYNNDNQMEKSVVLHKDGKTAHQSLYLYDEKGDLLEVETAKESDLLLCRSVWIYDDNGRKVKRFDFQENPRGTLHSIKSFDYKNNPTETIVYSKQGTVSQKETIYYKEFDTRGNWTRKIVHQEGEKRAKQTRIVERDIKYNE